MGKEKAMTHIGDLFDELEKMNFTVDGHPLHHAVPFVVLRQIFYDRLTDPIPQKYVRQYNLDDKEDRNFTVDSPPPP